MSKILNQVSYEIIQKHIIELENADLREADIERLKKLVSKVMNGYSTYTRYMKTGHIFRARRTSPGDFYNHISKLWYPPAEKAKLNRCNRARKPIFYCSDTEWTAIIEMQPIVDEYYTVLDCTLKDPENAPLIMELGLPEYSTPIRPQLGVGLLDNTKEGRSHLASHENIQKNLAIRSFLVRQFTRDVQPGNEFEYKITVAIAELQMQMDNIDGFCYPSIATDKRGVNMVLKPHSVDRLYKPESAWVILIEKELGPPKYQVLKIKTAKTIYGDGSIEW